MCNIYINIKHFFISLFFFIYFSCFIVTQKTEWDFDPEVGKQRRIRYEHENGHLGQYAIAKLGMGIGYKGPWGTIKN